MTACRENMNIGRTFHNHNCMLSGASGVLAGSSVGVEVLLMASLFHPCMVGSMSGGFASSACFQMQHCKWALSTFGLNDSFVGGRDINFGGRRNENATMDVRSYEARQDQK